MTKSFLPSTVFLTLTIGILPISLNGQASPRPIATFSPQSTTHLRDAVNLCLKVSPKGVCSELKHGPIGLWDVSRVTNMSGLFKGKKSFNRDISSWNVLRVTDMSDMFYEARFFNQDVSKWNVSRVTNMRGMFCKTAISKDISKWDVSRVTDMSRMFYLASSFRINISEWTVARVTTMHRMFDQAAVFDIDISKWDVSHVTDMNSMFKQARAFNRDISKWDVSRVTDMTRMFFKANSFDHKLCGHAWVSSNAKQDDMFLGTKGGSIKMCQSPSDDPAANRMLIYLLAGIAGVSAVLIVAIVVPLATRSKSGSEAAPNEPGSEVELSTVSTDQTSRNMAIPNALNLRDFPGFYAQTNVNIDINGMATPTPGSPGTPVSPGTPGSPGSYPMYPLPHHGPFPPGTTAAIPKQVASSPTAQQLRRYQSANSIMVPPPGTRGSHSGPPFVNHGNFPPNSTPTDQASAASPTSPQIRRYHSANSTMVAPPGAPGSHPGPPFAQMPEHAHGDNSANPGESAVPTRLPMNDAILNSSNSSMASAGLNNSNGSMVGPPVAGTQPPRYSMPTPTTPGTPGTQPPRYSMPTPNTPGTPGAHPLHPQNLVFNPAMMAMDPNASMASMHMSPPPMMAMDPNASMASIHMSPTPAGLNNSNGSMVGLNNSNGSMGGPAVAGTPGVHPYSPHDAHGQPSPVTPSPRYSLMAPTTPGTPGAHALHPQNLVYNPAMMAMDPNASMAMMAMDPNASMASMHMSPTPVGLNNSNGSMGGPPVAGTPGVHPYSPHDAHGLGVDQASLQPLRATSMRIRRLSNVVMGPKTFATSNYKLFYVEAQPADFQHDLLGAVNGVLKLYAKRMNPNLDPDEVDDGVHMSMTKIQEDAFENGKALKTDTGAVAEYLWTSARKHRVVQRMQLCSVLNAVIRDDVMNEIKEAAVIFRSINTRRVHRVNAGANVDVQSYPPNGETWRGGGFRKRHRPFFEGMVGKKYRVPAFLATSKKRSVAAGFVFKAAKTHPCAMWRVTFDPRGKDHPEFRVRHMTFVSKTLVPDEEEYLFAPYSVFTLKSAKWSSKLSKPHDFTLLAACDNQEEDEDLPLAPWY